MSMKKLGKKGGFNEGTLVAFACACNCNLCLCTSCNNCNTIPNAKIGRASCRERV